MGSEMGWDWVGCGIGYDAGVGDRWRWDWMVDGMRVKDGTGVRISGGMG